MDGRSFLHVLLFQHMGLVGMCGTLGVLSIRMEALVCM